MHTVWKYNSDTKTWELMYTAGHTPRIVASVETNGNWRTYDMDGAGGESGQESSVTRARTEAKESLNAMGYV